MGTTPPYVELAYAAVGVFTDDGTIDMAELNLLLSIALRDDLIDEDEKRILANIFDKVTEKEVDPDVWQRIMDIRRKHDI